MFSPPPRPLADPGDPPDIASARTAWKLGLLEELAELGMKMARDFQRQGEALTVAVMQGPAPANDDEPPPRPTTGVGAGVGAEAAGIGLGFARAAKAVRQTLALHTRYEQDGLAHEARRAEAREARAAARRERLETRRAEVWSAAHEVIQDDTRDTPQIERLMDELDDWLHDQSDEDFEDRPIGEMVQKLFAQLGLNFHTDLFDNEDWAVAEMETRPEGSPYAVPHRDRPPAPDDGAPDVGIWRPEPERPETG